MHCTVLLKQGNTKYFNIKVVKIVLKYAEDMQQLCVILDMIYSNSGTLSVVIRVHHPQS